VSGGSPTCHLSAAAGCLPAREFYRALQIEGQAMSYSGDKYVHCAKCRKKTRWVRCSNCRGRGPTWSTTCRYRCHGGYKCENGKVDPSHAPG
jgi:hypothetical protein